MANQSFFENSYKRAKSAEDLPWYRNYPPRFLAEAIKVKKAPARALDLGCGTGTYSVILAEEGYEVIGVDFVEAALDMARNRARDANVTVDFQHADVCDYHSDESFDLVLDSGCMHSLSDKERLVYRQKLLSWLRPGGQLVLVHFNKCNSFNWRPMGPRRWTSERVERFLGAEFRSRNYYEEKAKIAFPIGPTAKISTYWFERVSRASN